MILKKSNLISFLLIFSITSGLYAEEPYYNVNNSDYSLYIINLLFGPLSGWGPVQEITALSYVLTRLNAVVLSIGMVMLSYVFFFGTLKSAMEGEFLGQRWSSLTTPIRSVLGMSLLIPDPNGFCFIQKIVMWFVISGIGLANVLWEVIVANYQKGGGFNGISIEVTENDKQMTDRLASLAIQCNYMKSIGLIDDFAAKINTAQTNIEIVVTPKDSSQTLAPLVIFATSSGVDKQTLQKAGPGIINLFDIFSADPILNQIASNHMSFLENPSTNAPPYLHEQSEIGPWYDNFRQITAVSMMALSDKSNNGITPEKLRDYGWFSAGAMYWMLSTGIGSEGSYSDTLCQVNSISTCPVNSDTAPSSNINDRNTLGYNSSLVDYTTDITYLNSTITNFSQWAEAYENQPDPSKDAVKVALPSSKDPATKSMYGFIKALVSSDIFTQASKDPLRQFIEHCQKTIVWIVSFFISLLLGSFLSLGIAMSVAKATSALPYVAMFIFIGIILALMPFILMVLPVVAMGAFYLPLIPMMIFYAAGMTWLFKVVEALVAAPLVALTFVEPSDDDIGRAQEGLVMLLSLAFRPSLMIFGYGIALKVLSVGFFLIGKVIGSFINFSVGLRAFKLLAIIEVFIVIVVAITTRAFSLIYLIPDQVFRWLNLSGDDTEASSMIHETKSGAEQGIKTVSDLFKMCSGALEVVSKGVRELNPPSVR